MKGLTKERAIKAAQESMGITTECARLLNISRPTLLKYRKLWPELEAALQDATEQLVDFAASKLIENIANGEQKAIEYALDHNGGKGGWGTAAQKIEVSGQLGIVDIVKAAQQTWEKGEMLKP